MANTPSFTETKKFTAEAAEALNASGLAYAIGSRGQQDHQTAVNYFLKAAPEEHPDALYNLALAYEYGLGVSKNLVTSMKYHLAAAKYDYWKTHRVFRDCFHRHNSPQEVIQDRLLCIKYGPTYGFELGLLYESGLVDNVPNYPLAYQYYQQAAYQGLEEAKDRLGYLLENGLGVSQDLTQAFDWYRQAARGAKNSHRAKFHLGRCYRQGLGCSVDLERAEEWLRKALAQHFLPAIYEYIALAAAGFVPAQRYLGHCYLQGKGIPEDFQEGCYWIQLAAAQSPHLTGFIFRDGLGVAQDDEQAMWWFSQAALGDNADAKASVGFCYLNGKGIRKNYQDAFNWFKEAAEQGSGWGSYGLGLLYEQGLGVDQSYSKAIQWYQQAHQCGITQAQVRLGFFYAVGIGTQPIHWKAFAYYAAVVKKGEYNAAYNAGVLAHTAEYHLIHANNGRAFAYYRRAAALGDVAAKNNLGVLFEAGKDVYQDPLYPISSMQMANDDSKEWYQIKYERFISTLLNPQKAVDWYQQAAEQNHAAALFNLARCYQLGLGVPQDNQIALSYYRKAAKQQVAAAYNNLGVFHTWGLETPKNHTSALRYFIKAAKLGCTEAVANLDILRDAEPDEAFVYCLQAMINPVRCYQQMLLKNQKVVWLQGPLANESIEQDQIY